MAALRGLKLSQGCQVRCGTLRVLNRIWKTPHESFDYRQRHCFDHEGRSPGDPEWRRLYRRRSDRRGRNLGGCPCAVSGDADTPHEATNAYAWIGERTLPFRIAARHRRRTATMGLAAALYRSHASGFAAA